MNLNIRGHQTELLLCRKCPSGGCPTAEEHTVSSPPPGAWPYLPTPWRMAVDPGGQGAAAGPHACGQRPQAQHETHLHARV
eukprot:4001361-Prymnesium_polylepis.1